MKASSCLACVATVLGSLLSGCSAPSAAGGDEGAETQDLVNRATFDRAFATIEAIDYLPFETTSDGCYARAYYMSMELASERLESNSIFAMVKQLPDGSSGPSLRPLSGDRWSYHVAPVIEVGDIADSALKTVVDPSLGDHPFLLDDWLATMRVSADMVDVVLMKGAVLGDRQARRLAAEA